MGCYNTHTIMKKLFFTAASIAFAVSVNAQSAFKGDLSLNTSNATNNAYNVALVTNEYLTENSNLNNSTEMNELSPISSTATETDALAQRRPGRYYAPRRSYRSGSNGGFNAFVDGGFAFGVGDYGHDRVEFTGSIGYQFNPYVYLGGGLGMSIYTGKGSTILLPFFANARFNFTTRSIAPFLDLKLGYSVGDANGLYFSPMVGCRFATRGSSAFYVGLAYLSQGIDVKHTKYSYTTGALGFKLGYEF